MKHTRVVSLNARQAKPGVHFIDTTRCVSLSMNTQPSVPAFITHANLKCKKYIHLCDEIYVWFHLKVGNLFCSFYQVDWWNLMKQSVTVGAQLLWSGRYGCNNGRYGCTIVMSYYIRDLTVVVFFVVWLIKLLNRQSSFRWFETDCCSCAFPVMTVVC